MADRSVVVRLRAEIGGYQAAMAQAAAATTRVGTAATRAAAETAAAERNTTSAAGRMVQSATRNQQAWQQAGTSLTLFGAITLGALGLSAKAAMDWETAWTGVLKTVDGSPAQIAKLETELRGLAKALPVSHEEIAAVAEAAGQLGIKTKDVAGFTKVMLDLGNTTNLTSDEAATSIAQLMNVMQTAPEDVDNLGAALVDLGNNGASTERQIVQMAQRIAGAGAIIGLTEAEVLGIANAVASVGIEVEAGGSAISRILVDMSKAVSTGSSELDGFAKAAGMSSAEFVRAFEEDPASAFASFTEGLGAIDAAGGDVFTILDELGQSDIRVSRALLTMAKSGSLLRDSIELGTQAWEANTALVEEAGKRYATTESQIKSAKGSIVDAAITFGQTFLPMIAGAANAVGDFANAFGQIPGPIQAVIGGLALVTGAVTLLGGGFLLLAPRIVATRAAFRILAADLTGVAAAAGFARAGLSIMLPFGAAVAAFGGLAAMAFEDMKGGEVVPALKEIRTAIKGVTTEAESLGDVGGQFNNFGKILGMNVSDVKSVGDAFDQMLKPSTTDKVARFFDSFVPGEGYMQAVEQRVSSLDDALTAMIDDGDIESVNEFQAALMDSGYTAEQINELLPKTAEALFTVESAATDTGDAMVVMADGTTQSAEAFEEWRKKVTDASMTFIDPVGAYDAVIAANTAFAQSTADATEDAEDSWEDFYDGQTVNIADYLVELQKQVDAQAAYNTNLLALKTKVSSEYFSFLEGLGREGAPLVAALNASTVEQLDMADDLYIQGQNGGQALADGLNEADLTSAAQASTDKLVADIAAKGSALPPWNLTADAAPAQGTGTVLAASLDTMGATRPAWGLFADPVPARGTGTVLAAELDTMGATRPAWLIDANGQPAVDTSTILAQGLNTRGDNLSAWGLKANVQPALTTAESAVTTINSKGASIKVDADTSAADARIRAAKSLWAMAFSVPVSASTTSPQQTRAGGGEIYGPGTPTSDNILGIDELTGTPTAWVSPKEFVVNARAYQKHRALVQAINDDRVPALAAGGAPRGATVQPVHSYGGPTVTVTAPSMEGMAITGSLQVGENGLLNLIDGRIVTTGQARSAGVRAGGRR